MQICRLCSEYSHSETDCSTDCLITGMRSKLASDQVMGHGNRERERKASPCCCSWWQRCLVTDVYCCLLIVLLSYHQLCLWYSLMWHHFGIIMRVSFLCCHWGIIKLYRASGRGRETDCERVTCLWYCCCHSPGEAQLPTGCSSARFHNPGSLGEEWRALFTCHAVHPMHCLVAVMWDALKNGAVMWQLDRKCDSIGTVLRDVLVVICLQLESKILRTNLETCQAVVER